MADSIEHTIQIDAEPGVVFEALTAPGLLEKWLCHEADVEPRVGGRYNMRWTTRDRDASVRYEGDAEIIELVPSEVLAVRLAPDDGPSDASVIQFRTEAVDGVTRLAVTQTGFEGDDGQRERAAYRRGWVSCLNVLRSLIEDDPTSRLTPAWMHRDLETPGDDPCGIEWVDDSLFMSDGGRGRIYELNPMTGAIRRSFEFEGEPAGLAFDGESLWQADREDCVLVKIEPATGRVTKRMKLSQIEGEITGVAWDGSYLWVGVVAEFDGFVMRVHPRSAVIYNKFKVCRHVSGLCWDGSRLWVADFEARSLSALETRLGRTGKRVAVKGHPAGLAWDGERVWYADSEWKLASRILDDVFD